VIGVPEMTTPERGARGGEKCGHWGIENAVARWEESSKTVEGKTLGAVAF